MTTNNRNDIFSQGLERANAMAQMEKQFSVSKNEVLEKEFGISIPVYTALLPSKGLLYPEAHPLFKQENTEILAMSVQEEDIIRDEKLIQAGTMGVELIRSCLKNKRIDPSTLYPGDALSILYSIRAVSYGPEFRTNTRCPKCGTDQKVTVDLSLLEAKALPENIIEGNRTFRTTSPSGLKVEYKILTEAEEMQVSAEVKAKTKKGLRGNSGEAMLSAVIVSVNEITDRSKLSLLISRLPAIDALHIRKEVVKTQPGIVNEYHFECENKDCGHAGKYPIPLNIEFWLPDVER